VRHGGAGPASTSTESDDERGRSTRKGFVNSLRQFCTGPCVGRAPVGVSRYGPGSVPAVHLECCSPSGDRFDLVALRGYLVAPEAMRRQPGLWWLESEEHPHLEMEVSRALEDAIGSGRLGCWPYCVPAERWNEAAAQDRWLPRSPVSDGEPPETGQRGLSDPCLDALPLPLRPTDDLPLERDWTPTRSLRERLRDGPATVTYLFAQVVRVPRILLATISLAAGACYLAAVASWLWGLGGGITGQEIQDGVVLVFAALVASWITGLFEERLVSDGGVRFRLPRAEGRDRQPLLHLALDAYRAGVVLQLLAFAGFVLV
jgi:hypothetical protein